MLEESVKANPNVMQIYDEHWRDWFLSCCEFTVSNPDMGDGSWWEEAPHFDGGASVMHMGLTLYGRRDLRCELGEGDLVAWGLRGPQGGLLLWATLEEHLYCSLEHAVVQVISALVPTLVYRGSRRAGHRARAAAPPQTTLPLRGGLVISGACVGGWSIRGIWGISAPQEVGC